MKLFDKLFKKDNMVAPGNRRTIDAYVNRGISKKTVMLKYITLSKDDYDYIENIECTSSSNLYIKKNEKIEKQTESLLKFYKKGEDCDDLELLYVNNATFRVPIPVSIIVNNEIMSGNLIVYFEFNDEMDEEKFKKLCALSKESDVTIKEINKGKEYSYKLDTFCEGHFKDLVTIKTIDSNKDTCAENQTVVVTIDNGNENISEIIRDNLNNESAILKKWGINIVEVDSIFKPRLDEQYKIDLTYSAITGYYRELKNKKQ